MLHGKRKTRIGLEGGGGLDFEIRNQEIDQRHPVRLFADSSGIPPSPSLSRDSILSFCSSCVSFPYSLPFSFSFPSLSSSFFVFFSSHRISHSPSVPPESCLQIRATGFPTFYAHPNIQGLSATSTPY